MTLPAPRPLPSLLAVYMTAPGLAAARAAFSEDQIWEVIDSHSSNLLLAAADLLDGLPQAGGSGGLKKFKLDVLEFEYQAGSGGIDWSALATRLRARAATGTGGGPRQGSNPAPEFGDWGLR